MCKKEPNVKFSYRGKKMSMRCFSINDWIYNKINEKKSFYEIDLLEYVEKSSEKKQGVSIDIGANIGNHSVYFGLFCSEVVVSFEPNPDLIPILKYNMNNNNINSNIYNCGLGEKEGIYTLTLPDEHSNNIGGARLIEANKSTKKNIIVKKLDDVIKDIENHNPNYSFNIIKIDVEGMEVPVLKGGRKTIEKYKPELFLEIQSEQQMNEIIEILYPLGYKRIVSWAATPVWHFTHKSNLKPIRMLNLSFFIMRKKTFYLFEKIINLVHA